MQATFAFSLDLADDTDHAKKLMDAILSAFITVKAAAKELGAAFNPPGTAAAFQQRFPAKEFARSYTPGGASVPSVTTSISVPAAEAIAGADAQMKEFFAETPALPEATAVVPTKRGRKPKVDAFAPASVAGEPMQLEQQPAAEEVSMFDQPVENLQELIELGNSVCKNCGPKLVADALKRFNAGKYPQIPQDKWVEVASVWRRALNASVK